MTAETFDPENATTTTVHPGASALPMDSEHEAPKPTFDLEREALSFSGLEAARAVVYESPDHRQRFRQKVESMPTSAGPAAASTRAAAPVRNGWPRK